MPSPSPLIPPPQVNRILEFVNTNAGRQPERLGDAAGLREWLQEQGFGLLDTTAADAATARELRDAIATLMLFHSGGYEEGSTAYAEAEDQLRRLAARHPVECVITADGARLRTTQAEVPGAFATIIAAVTELAFTGAWQRMKTCRNPPCHEGFYDHSRNGSASFHSPGCGSQVSMRAYRARQRST